MYGEGARCAIRACSIRACCPARDDQCRVFSLFTQRGRKSEPFLSKQANNECPSASRVGFEIFVAPIFVWAFSRTEYRSEGSE